MRSGGVNSKLLCPSCEGLTSSKNQLCGKCVAASHELRKVMVNYLKQGYNFQEIVTKLTEIYSFKYAIGVLHKSEDVVIAEAKQVLANLLKYWESNEYQRPKYFAQFKQTWDNHGINGGESTLNGLM